MLASQHAHKCTVQDLHHYDADSAYKCEDAKRDDLLLAQNPRSVGRQEPKPSGQRRQSQSQNTWPKPPDKSRDDNRRVVCGERPKGAAVDCGSRKKRQSNCDQRQSIRCKHAVLYFTNSLKSTAFYGRAGEWHLDLFPPFP